MSNSRIVAILMCLFRAYEELKTLVHSGHSLEEYVSGCLVLICSFSSALLQKLLSHSGHVGHWSANSCLCKFSLVHLWVFGINMLL